MFIDLNNIQKTANPNDSQSLLGNIPVPPKPQMKVVSKVVKPEPPSGVVDDTPPPVEEPIDDGTVKTSLGVFKVKSPGEYYYNDGAHDIKIDAADVPPEVTSYAAKKYPAPGEIVVGDKRYKSAPDGSIHAYMDKLGKWGQVPDDQVDNLPEEVRRPYYQSKQIADKNLGAQVFQSPMWGNVRATDDQVQKQEQDIQGISDAMTGSKGLHGITSEEKLRQAQVQAQTDYDVAQKTGNPEMVATAKERMQQLKDTHIKETPEGGYMMWVKNPIGDTYTLHTVTPKEPKKPGEYDWTKDPIQMQAEGTARAEYQNRHDVSQQANQVMFNDVSNKIVNDYIGRYAQDYRLAQLSGNHPSEARPDQLIEALKQQMNPATADPEAAKKTIQEMQKGLASFYGDGWLSLRPNFFAPSSYNDGIMDKIPGRIPEHQQEGFEVKSQIIANPKTAAQKDIKQTPFVIPNHVGKLDHAQNSMDDIVNNLGADQSNSDAMLALGEGKLYKDANAPMKDYVTANGQHTGASANRVIALEQHVQERMTDPVFRNKLINGFTEGIAGKAEAIALEAAKKNGVTTTGTDTDGNPISSKEKYKNPSLGEGAKNEAMKSLFGTPYFGKSTWLDPNTNKEYDRKEDIPKPAKVGDKGLQISEGKEPVEIKKEWSDAGVIKKYTSDFFKLPRDKQVEVAKDSPYAKSLLMLEGVGTGRNGHLEIDSRLGDMAQTEIVKSLLPSVLPESEAFIQNNKKYFEDNINSQADPDTQYNTKDLTGTAAQINAVQMIRKIMRQLPK